jgi:hypothetical protein
MSNQRREPPCRSDRTAARLALRLSGRAQRAAAKCCVKLGKLLGGMAFIASEGATKQEGHVAATANFVDGRPQVEYHLASF